MSKEKNPQQDEKLLDHDYDGIQELDNPLPRWWIYGFYLTIIFSVLYVGYYEFGPGQSLQQVYEARVGAIEEKRAAEKQGGFDDAVLLAAAKDHAAVATGGEVYATRCAACHGAVGEGLIGPNLTDEFWLHGGSPGAIAKTIRDGVGDKGMPAWGDSITPDELKAAVGFILTLQGTNPPNAKEPQGESYKPQGT